MEVHRIHFDCLDSTNTWAKAHSGEFDPKKLTCISASTQTKGHGRFNHPWVSKQGNLHISFFFCLSPGDPRLPNLAQIAAFAICSLLLEKGFSIQIKWPNDLIFDKKKLGGILVETTPIGKQLGIIVGIGLNVNAPIEGFISLSEIKGAPWDLESLIDEMIFRFQKELEKGFSPQAFDALLAFKGELVSCYVGDKLIEGTLLGLNDQGQLKLKLSDGTVAHFSSGEINILRTQ